LSNASLRLMVSTSPVSIWWMDANICVNLERFSLTGHSGRSHQDERGGMRVSRVRVLGILNVQQYSLFPCQLSTCRTCHRTLCSVFVTRAYLYTHMVWYYAGIYQYSARSRNWCVSYAHVMEVRVPGGQVTSWHLGDFRVILSLAGVLKGLLVRSRLLFFFLGTRDHVKGYGWNIIFGCLLSLMEVTMLHVFVWRPINLNSNCYSFFLLFFHVTNLINLGLWIWRRSISFVPSQAVTILNPPLYFQLVPCAVHFWVELKVWQTVLAFYSETSV
jgi:hypothetical protein